MATKAAKKSTTKTASKTASKKASKSKAGNYTKPELREKIKKRVMAGEKGGRAGQWSARKAQLVAHEYEAQGGGYQHPRNESQKSLKQWGDEKWRTTDGKQAIQGEKTSRYLPDAAWKELSPEERKATELQKVAGSQQGRQFANTPAAAQARKRATRHDD